MPVKNVAVLKKHIDKRKLMRHNVFKAMMETCTAKYFSES